MNILGRTIKTFNFTNKEPLHCPHTIQLEGGRPVCWLFPVEGEHLAVIGESRLKIKAIQCFLCMRDNHEVTMADLPTLEGLYDTIDKEKEARAKQFYLRDHDPKAFHKHITETQLFNEKHGSKVASKVPEGRSISRMKSMSMMPKNRSPHNNIDSNSESHPNREKIHRLTYVNAMPGLHSEEQDKKNKNPNYRLRNTSQNTKMGSPQGPRSSWRQYESEKLVWKYDFSKKVLFRVRSVGYRNDFRNRSPDQNKKKPRAEVFYVAITSKF